MIGEEVRKLKSEEIQVELSKLRMSLFDLHSQRVTDKVADTSQFRKIRADIARLLTERRARQIAKAPVKHAAAAKAPAKTPVVKPKATKSSAPRKAPAKAAASKAKK
jgi:large subunit ribosomal protein L29